MAEHLRNNTDADFVTIDQLQIFLLLFADDTAIFAETEYGLQSLLNGLHDYCNRWGITVNIGKTKVVVFQGSNRHCNTQFTYANTVLENVTSFTYLGITLSSNGKFFQAQKHLSEQATKDIFSLNSLFDKVSTNNYRLSYIYLIRWCCLSWNTGLKFGDFIVLQI